MHAELTVGHRGGNLVALLAASLPPHDPTVIPASAVIGAQPHLWGTVELAVQTPSFRLLCWQNTALETQAFIEAVGTGDLKASCQAVWQVAQRAGASLDPELARLEITDETSGRAVSVAQTGFGAQVQQRERASAVGIGLVTAIVMVVAAYTFGRHERAALAVGAAPALAAGTLALVWAVLDSLRARLVWS